jgi:CheY-like chemotaxis protein
VAITRTEPAVPLVFVVEDEPLVREFLEWALGRHYRVRAFGNGREALDALLREAPDLLLSDLDLPGLPGEALAARARALALPPTIVFMSADATRLERAGSSGDAILEKPFSLVEALGLVETCFMLRGACSRPA